MTIEFGMLQICYTGMSCLRLTNIYHIKYTFSKTDFVSIALMLKYNMTYEQTLRI